MAERGETRPAGGRGGGPRHPPGQGPADRARPVRRLGRPGGGARLRARELEATLWRGRPREPDPAEIEPLLDELASPEGLTAQRSSFARAEVLRELCARAGPGWGAGALGEAADAFLSSDRVVLLCPDEAYAPARYSTPELLATERQLLDGSDRAPGRRRRPGGRADPRGGAGRPSRALRRAGGDGARADGIRRRPAGGAGAGRLGQDLCPGSCPGGLGGRGPPGDRRRPVGASRPGAPAGSGIPSRPWPAC